MHSYQRGVFPSPKQTTLSLIWQVNGLLLCIKSFLETLLEGARAESLPGRIASLQPVVSLAGSSRCPTIAAECVEIGRLLLQHISVDKRLHSHDEAVDLAKDVRHVCRKIVRALTGHSPGSNENDSSPASRLGWQLMRPVLIESSVAGFLESWAVSEATHASEGSIAAGLRPDLSGTLQTREQGQGIGADIRLLLTSADAEVQRAALRTLLTMVSKGKASWSP